MAVDKKRRSFRKKYFKLRRSGTWLSILAYLIILCILFIFLTIFGELVALFVINSNIEGEYGSKKQMAEMVESVAADAEDEYRMLDSAGIDYFIKDKDGKVLHSKNADTCGVRAYTYYVTSETSTLTIMPSDSETLTEEDIPRDLAGSTKLYADTQNKVLYPDDDDNIHIDFGELWENLKSFVSVNGESVELSSVKYPIWETVTLDDGRELVFKAFVTFDISDIGVALGLAAVMVLLLVVIFIVMVVNAISKGISQRRTIKLFFTDMVTKGHNWMWFLFKGDQVIRRRNWSKSGLSAVNVKFVGYRRFCVCHSIEEGEQLLCRIYNTIQSALTKKELCAHTSDGSYALMLRCGDEETLRGRLKELTELLTRIGVGHSLAFHIGANIIKLPEESSFKLFFKGSDVDIELEYNNACTARVSLDGSEDSGVAFFDEKLVEDQRWIDTVQDRQQAALQNEEFVVYYQPKYDPRTNELRGAEALIRWQSPEFGFVTPYKFIPIFENNGFITEIDHYMISHVARDQRRWLDMGYRCVPVSVNVSRAHFIESDLAEQIRDMVHAAGTPHELIEIELNESAFFDDKKAMVNTIAKLKSYGFS
ncbi:MAG: EAL domain-containing protein, partial [Ruminococcus sp.]|nr:EAL domain-containing protein [Ruminococcus sp.]